MGTGPFKNAPKLILEFLPQDTLFLLLSFEGPDLYSQTGGLGVRVSELSCALAHAGYMTHLFFVGDPKLPGEESHLDGRLIYHRWCQWISKHHPLGVYDGEEDKIRDYEKSLPPWIIQNIVKKKSYKNIVILCEEWQTAGTTIQLSKLTDPSALLVWNANNTFGFHRIPWKLLERSAAITTVSRYMKHLMWREGVNPLVIPNGIPQRWFSPIPSSNVKELRNSLSGNFFLVKIGRFDPDKQWLMAIHGLAILKNLGFKPQLFMRGGIERHGDEVRQLAKTLGLNRVPIKLSKNPSLKDLTKALLQEKSADIYDLQFFIPETMLRLFYRAADAVLANSRHEPFGLVGLEVMASGGMAVTGNSGEEYAENFHNALTMETSNPSELASSLVYLSSHPKLAEKLRENGKTTAKRFRWNFVIEELKRKLSFVSIQNQRKEPVGFETFRYG